MLISHVIKTDQYITGTVVDISRKKQRSDPHIRLAPHFVVSHLGALGTRSVGLWYSLTACTQASLLHRLFSFRSIGTSVLGSYISPKMTSFKVTQGHRK